MIFIVVKFTIRSGHTEDWLDLVEDFTQATRQEPGNLFFEWTRSVEHPNQFVPLEAFASREAGEAHVTSEHFKSAMAWIPRIIEKTPEIVNFETPGEGWAEMAELTPAQ